VLEEDEDEDDEVKQVAKKALKRATTTISVAKGLETVAQKARYRRFSSERVC
jgi:hypothetical protein